MAGPRLPSRAALYPSTQDTIAFRSASWYLSLFLLLLAPASTIFLGYFGALWSGYSPLLPACGVQSTAAAITALIAYLIVLTFLYGECSYYFIHANRNN